MVPRGAIAFFVSLLAFYGAVWMGMAYLVAARQG
jgi:hypothetical protein